MSWRSKHRGSDSWLEFAVSWAILIVVCWSSLFVAGLACGLMAKIFMAGWILV